MVRNKIEKYIECNSFVRFRVKKKKNLNLIFDFSNTSEINLIL